ncbi:hypothetical protein [Paenibacillus montaniterrae]|uniref:hypothetical protein n=1 Tax=Paenibacillus montaniterrae TaxID=429341 RepID=UPI001BCA93D8|nr:hypothetical protein [Paenibacillus montaniterrae]
MLKLRAVDAVAPATLRGQARLHRLLRSFLLNYQDKKEAQGLMFLFLTFLSAPLAAFPHSAVAFLASFLY